MCVTKPLLNKKYFLSIQIVVFWILNQFNFHFQEFDKKRDKSRGKYFLFIKASYLLSREKMVAFL